MKNIITIQHPQSLHHINGMVGSWTDWDLSELGVEQAHLIGENLKKELKTKYIIYSSDLKRTKQTAEIVAKYLDGEVLFDQRLRERNLGMACGKSVEWLKANIKSNEVTVDDRLFPDSESKRDGWNRLKSFLEMILESEDQNIIIVSHGDILSIFNAMWLGLEIEDLNHYSIFGKAGGVSHFKETDEGLRIINRISDLSYMKK